MERTPLGFLLVAAGGFLGAAVRHGVTGAVVGPTGTGTLAVNAVGSFALGLLVSRATTTRTQLFVGTGALSSFTTYSTFVGDAVALGGAPGAAYVAASYGIGFAAALGGLLIGGRL